MSKTNQNKHKNLSIKNCKKLETEELTKFLIDNYNITDDYRIECRKFRCFLTKQQEDFFNFSVGCFRFIFNWVLEKQFKTAWEKYEYKNKKKEIKTRVGFNPDKLISDKDLDKQLTKLKNQCPFLKKAESTSLQQALQIANKAVKECAYGIRGGVFFKSKKTLKQGITTVKKSHNIYFAKNENLEEINPASILTFVKAKFGDIVVNRHRPINGQLTNKVVLTRENNGQYFICLFVKVKRTKIKLPKVLNKIKAVGIDLGLKKRFCDSGDNQAIDKSFQTYINKELKSIKRLFEHTKKIGSKISKLDEKYFPVEKDANGKPIKKNDKLIKSIGILKRINKGFYLKEKKYKPEEVSLINYHKLKQQFENLWIKINRKRMDLIYKICNYYCKHFDLIGMESLGIQEMKKNPIVAKDIDLLPFYAFKQAMLQVSRKNGNLVMLANQYFPSSQICSHCGTIGQLHDRTFVCPECSKKIDRDLNAAINLKNEALRQYSLIKNIVR